MQWKLIVDFGLVILIWMTQLIVYPSFTYFSEHDLISWHAKYTTAISIIVMPLMLAQVGLHGFALVNNFTWLGIGAALMIALAWANTFFYAVPLHNQITAEKDVLAAASGLVKVNWYRTALWSLVFLFGLFDYLRN